MQTCRKLNLPGMLSTFLQIALHCLCIHDEWSTVADLQPRGRLGLAPTISGKQEGGDVLNRELPRLARLTEAISTVLDDYTMVSLLHVMPRGSTNVSD